MFIQSEPTPNPNSRKFIPNEAVTGSAQTYDFADIESASESHMALSLFQIGGVDRVFLGRDFISITKGDHAEWKHIQPMVQAAIMDHYMAGLPVVSVPNTANITPNIADGNQPCEDDDEIVTEIKALIETRVRPAVAQDGGDIIFHSFEAETGLVKLTLLGACAGCPSSTMTLKQGVENMLRAYVPEVSAVEAVL